MLDILTLELITSNPAKIVDVFDRVESIEMRKVADALIWSDMPAVATDAVLETVLLDGEIVKSLKM